jgi:hypothetical protein
MGHRQAGLKAKPRTRVWKKQPAAFWAAFPKRDLPKKQLIYKAKKTWTTEKIEKANDAIQFLEQGAPAHQVTQLRAISRRTCGKGNGSTQGVGGQRGSGRTVQNPSSPAFPLKLTNCYSKKRKGETSHTPL